jgi:radical SAM protein with 4Fe4S-binding SPASM domain
MANILFTTYCNRNCSYCFAKSKVDLNRDTGDPSKNLNRDNLEKIIRFYKQSLLTRIAVLGGEPTLNPDFIPLMDRIFAEPSFKSVMLFTNGVIPDKALTYLAGHRDQRLKIAMNLNSPGDYLPHQQDRINQAMACLNSRVGLGANIHRAGQNYGYLIEAITTYKLAPHIRVGLTHPIVESKNNFAQRTDLPAIARDLVMFAKAAFEHRITYSFDCGFPFCMFTLDQHKELLRYGIKFRSECAPIVDIGPDLSVWRCFPMLNDVCGHLGRFRTRDEIIEHYHVKYKHIMAMGNRAECPQCRYRVNNLCRGGCLARTLIDFQHSPTDHDTNVTR